MITISDSALAALSEQAERLVQLEAEREGRRARRGLRPSKAARPRCGARTRAGRPCRAPRFAYRVGGTLHVCRRCRMHGGAAAAAHRRRHNERSHAP